MPALSDYTAGTITLTNGSNAFTGVGTGWQAASFREGDTILGIEDHAGVEYVIATIDDNGEGTLTQDWEGATGTYTYRMRYLADGARVTAQARNLIELLGNGNLQALAGLTGPGVPVFNGPHAMVIKPEADFVNGVAYDVQVDTLSDRDAYDGQSEGFSVLVSDIGDGRSALYSKASNTVADWSDPAYITGPVGPIPDVEATVDMLPPGSAATVTPTPIMGGVRLDFELPEASGFYNAGVYDIAEPYDQDDVVSHNSSSFIALQPVPIGESPSSASPPVDTAYWQVLAAKGQDGTGTGDVVGPSGAVTNRIAVFDGTTGKLIKDGGKTLSDYIEGSLGSTDNVLLRTDGTGGKTAQGSTATLTDAGLLSAVGLISTRAKSDTVGPGSNAGEFIGKDSLWATRTGTDDSFNLDVSTGGNALKVTAAGYVLKPKTPRFNAVLASNFTPNLSTLTAFGGAWSSTVRVNVGSHFVPSTGRFTAPVAGDYRFSVTAGGYLAASGLQLWLYRNGSSISGGGCYMEVANGVWTAAGMEILIPLSVGDYVELYGYSYNAGNFLSAAYTNFVGELLG